MVRRFTIKNGSHKNMGSDYSFAYRTTSINGMPRRESLCQWSMVIQREKKRPKDAGFDNISQIGIAVDEGVSLEKVEHVEVVTSYTRWVEAVQVRGENQDVCLGFSLRLKLIWPQSKPPRFLRPLSSEPRDRGQRT
jgi:hypothetical protein